MRPHRDLGRVVDEFEQASHGAKVLVLFTALELDLEEGVVVAFALRFFDFDSREFLVGREPGGGDIVREQVSAGYNMAEFDEVTVFDGEISSAVIGGWGSGKDNPVVVGVVVGVASHLLA